MSEIDEGRTPIDYVFIRGTYKDMLKDVNVLRRAAEVYQNFIW